VQDVKPATEAWTTAAPPMPTDATQSADAVVEHIGAGGVESTD
jgi:hypothetical protein